MQPIMAEQTPILPKSTTSASNFERILIISFGCRRIVQCWSGQA
jgi:hypothetical protein